MVRRKGHKLSDSILEAVIFYIQHLDETNQQLFRASLQRVVADAATECQGLIKLSEQILLPGESVSSILHGRSEQAVQRRKRLFKDALSWVSQKHWDDFKKEFPAFDPDSP